MDNKMRQLIIEIVCLLAALLVKDSLTIETESICKREPKVCSTPDGWQGECINILQCPALVELLSKEKITAKESTFLKESKCDTTIGKNVFACCRYQNNSLLPDTRICGQSFENRIIGGSAMHIDEYPWLALLEYTFPSGTKLHLCGGSLINNRYVLTVAHCVNTKGKVLSGVRLGEWNTLTDPDCEVMRNGKEVCADPHVDFGIEQMHVHPNYSVNSNNEGPYSYNDIALLRLNRDVVFTDFIRPICLPVRPHQRSETFDDVEMQVSGWGLTNEFVRSKVKNKLTVKGYEFERCREKYLTQKTQLKEPQMCAGGEPYKDACEYDSGGPLIVLQCVDSRDVYVQVGITSFGAGCGTLDFPGVYTRVGAYMEWIENLLKP